MFRYSGIFFNDIYNNLCWQPCFLLTYFMKFHIIHRKNDVFFHWYFSHWVTKHDWCRQIQNLILLIIITYYLLEYFQFLPKNSLDTSLFQHGPFMIQERCATWSNYETKSWLRCNLSVVIVQFVSIEVQWICELRS